MPHVRNADTVVPVDAQRPASRRPDRRPRRAGHRGPVHQSDHRVCGRTRRRQVRVRAGEPVRQLPGQRYRGGGQAVSAPDAGHRRLLAARPHSRRHSSPVALPHIPVRVGHPDQG